MANHWILLLLVFCPLVAIVHAYSSGKTDICDPYANWGCDVWDEVTKVCSDASPGIMPWVQRPVRTGNYTVRTGNSASVSNDQTSYTPGELLTIYVAVKHLDWKYRGLLIRARAGGKTVGDWELPPPPVGDDALFWSPSTCPKSLLHNNATPKPFEVALRFRAPPAGTGTITFETLIKRGPANVGEFYYPNLGIGGDVQLTEGAASASGGGSSSSTAGGSGGSGGPQWHMSSVGESCSVVCGKKGLGCDAKAMSGARSAAQLAAAGTACAQPLLSDCSSVSPTLGPQATCYVHSATCADGGAGQPVSCDATGGSDANGRRFCACSAAGAAAAPGRLLQLLTTGAAAAVLLLGGGGRSGVGGGRASLLLLVAVVALWALPTPASAHNWILTPGRAQGQAKTIRPCLGRRSSDTHAQVGPGQEFVVKWAVGHAGDVYWSVVAGGDLPYLTQSNYTDILDEYIAAAPAGNNVAQQPAMMRYRGVRDFRDYFARAAAFRTDKTFFKRELFPGDPNFLTHPRTDPNEKQLIFEYATDKIAPDRRVSYASAAHPYLIQAGRFRILQQVDHNYDIMRIRLPADLPPGHYVVNYWWRGYYDCTDVDVFPTPVQNVYGIVDSSFVFDRVDHCLFVEPRQVTPAVLLPPGADASACAQLLIDTLGKGRGADVKTLGLNVVPLVPPATSLFADQFQYTPWQNRTLAGPLTLLSGAVTRSPLSWSAWDGKTTTTAGRRCSSTAPIPGASGDVTLREAVAACSPSSCLGLSWDGQGAAASAARTGSHPFRLCTAAATTADAAWTVFMKNLPTPPATVNPPNPSFTIHFQKPGSTPPGGASDYADTGAPFGASAKTPSLSYGWNCALPNGALSGNYLKLEACSNGGRAWWEAAVPNGVYKVTATMDVGTRQAGMRGCDVENVQLATAFLASIPFTNTVRVVVTDGRITLQSGGKYHDASSIPFFGTNFCQLRTMRVERVAAAQQDAWLPPSANPWWQMDLGSAQPVGLVSVTPPPSCRAFWLWRGTGCAAPLSSPFNQAEQLPHGWLGLQGQLDVGAVVSVSNTSCSSGGGGGCSTAGEVVCNTMMMVQRCGGKGAGACTTMGVRCNGVTGRYVRVKLPGAKRQLDLGGVEVHRWRPAGLAAGSHVCYGVEGRVQTNTRPSMVTTTDTQDPMFYSTCYERVRNITWLPPVNAQSPVPRYSFNGKCLNCANFAANQKEALSAAPGAFPVRVWEVSQNCFDCTSLAAGGGGGGGGSGSESGAGGTTAAAWPISSQPYTGGGVGGGAFKAVPGGVFGVVGMGVGALALVLSTVVLVVACRRRNRAGAGTAKYHGAATNSHAAQQQQQQPAVAAAAVEMAGPPQWAPPPQQQQQPLPHPWAEAQTETGEVYYHNTATGVTQWERPGY